MFPVMLCLRGKRCLVVGGGGVALRKVEGLLVEGAAVTVVASVPGAPLRELAAAGKIELAARAYREGETSGYTLVFAATDDRAANLQVVRDAEAAGVWVNVADDPELCSFQLPARVRRGALEVAIGSSGEAPFAVRRLREAFERRLGPEWGEWLDAAARFRRAVRDGVADSADRERRFDRFFEATVDRDRLTARVPTWVEVAEWLGDGEGVDAAAGGGRIAPSGPASQGRHGRGFVSLVGGGPGDAGLLTLRGRARLLAADAVVYDRLAASALPCDLSAGVELHCVGKEAGQHPVPQEEINALLVRLAFEGKRVVRLKGGDPYVFGRGGEEAEALVEAGIAFEVVPGVTAGIAVPAFAGIPVTHRREAVRVSLVTGHECSKDDGPQVRWELMAQDAHATIVGYMGVSNLAGVVGRLLDAGMRADTPAAVVERGGTSAQRVVRASLARLPGAVTSAGLRPPALFVIGPTASLAGRLDWFSTRPLAGQRLLIAAGDGPLVEALELAGAEVVVVPLPVTPAAEVVAGALPLTGVVLRDPLEADALEGVRDRLAWDGAATWCLGGGTASRAREQRWRQVEELDGDTGADGIVAALVDRRAPAAAG